MNELQIFQNREFGELWILERDGKPYFPATTCAKILGYANAKDAIIRHCKGVVKHDLPTAGGIQTVNLIPEGDLYRLITHSRLPAAERFETWVFDEVLPTIRRTGGYGESAVNKTTRLDHSSLNKSCFHDDRADHSGAGMLYALQGYGRTA